MLPYEKSVGEHNEKHRRAMYPNKVEEISVGSRRPVTSTTLKKGETEAICFLRTESSLLRFEIDYENTSGLKTSSTKREEI